MKNEKLNIVTFNCPLPANYGGVIDVFYKIKALHESGIKIFLHCYVKEMPTQENIEILKTLTQEVHFYIRRNNFLTTYFYLPYPVISRIDKKLILRLNSNLYPIFFEGLQSTGIVLKGINRKKTIVRLHNIESNYYKGISKSEKNIFKKIIYYFESIKYRNYEKKVIPYFDKVFTISNFETNFVKKHNKNTKLLPVFHGNKNCNSSIKNDKKYAFFNGDLRTSDNKRALEFFVEIFKKLPEIKFIVASNYFNEKFLKKNSFQNIEFIIPESQNELTKWLSKAHVVVMVSFQESGTKLKLLNSIYQSKFILCNQNLTDDKELLGFCTVANTANEFVDKIIKLMNEDFFYDSNRIKFLYENYNDLKNAQQIIESL